MKFKTFFTSITYLSLTSCTIVGAIIDNELDTYSESSVDSHRQANQFPEDHQKIKVSHLRDNDVGLFSSLGAAIDGKVVSKMVESAKSSKPTAQQVCKGLTDKKLERCLNEAAMAKESNQAIKVEVIDKH